MILACYHLYVCSLAAYHSSLLPPVYGGAAHAMCATERVWSIKVAGNYGRAIVYGVGWSDLILLDVNQYSAGYGRVCRLPWCGYCPSPARCAS